MLIREVTEQPINELDMRRFVPDFAMSSRQQGKKKLAANARDTYKAYRKWLGQADENPTGANLAKFLKTVGFHKKSIEHAFSKTEWGVKDRIKQAWIARARRMTHAKDKEQDGGEKVDDDYGQMKLKKYMSDQGIARGGLTYRHLARFVRSAGGDPKKLLTQLEIDKQGLGKVVSNDHLKKVIDAVSK